MVIVMTKDIFLLYKIYRVAFLNFTNETVHLNRTLFKYSFFFTTMLSEKIKALWGKFWFLLWEDDSFKGWLFSVIFLFLFIKLIFFPFLSLVTGTSLPLAIVESCSMYHDGNLFSDYDEWWKRHEEKYLKLGIDKDEFDSFPFRKGFNKGDIIFIIGANPETLEVGDVIVFDAGRKNPIIHRIINISSKSGKLYFSTIGDNNAHQIAFEKEISEEKLMGKAVFRIAPYIGWIKLIFFESKKPSSVRGFCYER